MYIFHAEFKIHSKPMYKINFDMRESFQCSMQYAVPTTRFNPEDQTIIEIILYANIYLHRNYFLFDSQQLNLCI